MPPTLALILTLGFIFFLFRQDVRQKPNVTSAIWLPTLWLFIIASQPISHWIKILGLPVTGSGSVEEGSPIDAIANFSFMALGVYVLARRRVSLSSFLRDNPWLTLFFLYSFLAILWSDFPLTSFKRWVKIFSHPIMILVIFTEPFSGQALITVMKRCSYVLFPVSILWMKYYPALGRMSDEWGAMANGGIAGGKNQLGSICLTFGFFLVWYGVQLWRSQKSVMRRNELILTVGLLLLIGYCLRKSHSSTSVISLVLSTLILLGLGFRAVNKRAIGIYAALGLCILAVAQLIFDLYGSIVDLSGHESTLEGRGHLWEVLLQTNTHPILGTGFESYWLGERMQTIANIIRWHPNEAHNGFLEAYLNLGIFGVGLLIMWILTTLWRCRQRLLTNFEWGRFTLAYTVAIIAHNWTEAGFKGLSIIFFGFFLVAIKYLQFEVTWDEPFTVRSGSEDRSQLAYAHTGAEETGIGKVPLATYALGSAASPTVRQGG